ncbi:Ig-like domain-containing protein [Streptomyces sp. NPDC021100]|uniref:Ig-like domain-containing protein n=1 Tax=Streptomyces sp. NPDC021100 TaxID=3365114 RepID=UPI003789020A
MAADFSYTVRPDGTVDYDASCDRFLSGRGTGTLVVGGFPVVLSAAGADSDLLGLEGLPDPAPRPPRELAAVLVPAKGYQPRTTYGVCSGFRLGRDGTPAAHPAGARSYRAGNDGPRAAADGPPVTLTVRIARAVPGGPPPRGSVTFTAGGQSLGTVLVDGVGLASLRTATVPAGAREIVVAYEGDDAHRPCTTTLRLPEGARPASPFWGRSSSRGAGSVNCSSSTGCCRWCSRRRRRSSMSRSGRSTSVRWR